MVVSNNSNYSVRCEKLLGGVGWCEIVVSDLKVFWKDRVRAGHGKPGKSWNLTISFPLKFRCGSWKVMENQYVFYEWKTLRSKVEKFTGVFNFS